jgi:hypothetical protein
MNFLVNVEELIEYIKGKRDWYKDRNGIIFA